jgi:cell division transport system permease protein
MNYHLKTAVNSIKRFPFQAMAAVFVLTITFFVGTILSVLAYSSAKTLKYFETRPQVIAFLKSEATPESISALQHKLSGDIRVKEVRYVSKEEALSIYKSATSDNPLLGELVNPSIFPASLEFSLINLSETENVIAEIKTEAIVDSVEFTASLGGEKNLSDVVVKLKNATKYLRIGGGIFAFLLIGTSFLVLVVTLGMRIASKKDEVEILSLVGAKAAFIRKPIILESLAYVLVGVIVGWLLTLITVLYIAPWAISYFGDIPILPKNPLSLFALFGIILGIEIFGGIVLALLGSNLAFSRARKTR